MNKYRFPIPGLRPPAPPDDLRARVLREALSARREESRSLLDLLWESRRARLTAAALLASLLVMNLALSRRTGWRVESSGVAVRGATWDVEGIPLSEESDSARARRERRQIDFLVRGPEVTGTGGAR